MLKRFITSLFCLIFIFVSIPLFGITRFLSVPVYASTDIPDGYNPASTDYDLVQSFNDYVKSRNAQFNGTIPDAMQIYLLNRINKGAQALGDDIDTVKQGIAKKSTAGGKIIWYLDSQTTHFYNRLFDYLLQDMDLEVGDTANLNLYSGEMFSDEDGNSCLVWIVTTNSFNYQNQPSSNIRARGTYYVYSTEDLILNTDTSTNYSTNYLNFHFYNGTKSTVYYHWGDINKYSGNSTKNEVNNSLIRFSNGSIGTSSGFYVITKTVGNTSDSPYNLTLYSYTSLGKESMVNKISNLQSSPLPDGESNQTDINFVTINNQTINNNNYQGNTYITDDGDVTSDDPSPQPGGKDPGWDVNGGQGSSGDTIINFPDFQLPDLNIDWSISGLGNKFPFSIPFDIASLVAVLNAEPEAPRFQGTMDLGITTYEYDINLAQFDSVASACRIAELLLLVFGLIMITRSIIKG